MACAERVDALEARARELEQAQGQVHGESTEKLAGVETTYHTLKVRNVWVCLKSACCLVDLCGHFANTRVHKVSVALAEKS